MHISLIMPLAVLTLALHPAALLRAQTSPIDPTAGAGQKAKSQSVQGAVTNIAPDRTSFTIADKSGAPVVVRVGPATSYQFNKNASTFDETVQVGLTVKGTLAPDGTASQVTSKSQKASPSAAVDQLQQVLAADDEEWGILRPIIANIQALQNQMSASTIALKSIQPSTASVDAIKTELAARRAAQAKLAGDLAKARAELTRLITVRQELILLQLGILE